MNQDFFKTNRDAIDKIILNALEEDMPSGDITTESTVSPEQISDAMITAKDNGVIAGIEITKRVFELLDPSIKFYSSVNDGAHVIVGDVLLKINGKTNVLLRGERVSINVLGHMSGIATKTSEFVSQVNGTIAKIYDTRKTTPGLRLIEKYAVTVGGGVNHRFSLSDAVLIKDNHIKAAGSIANAVHMTKSRIPQGMKIEVETETLPQVVEALASGADIIMLDNMSLDTMREAVSIVKGRAATEASGNMDLENNGIKKSVREVALTGVDIISVGSLTHTITNLDVSMKIL
jgi:nicotinate-nucleotide pyrophosphorylase (carboxylating)